MAISYSYPMGTPKLTDTVLGVQYEEMKDPAVKNFSIGDIVTLAVDEVGIPTLQNVTGEGANTTVQMQINGVDVATLDDIPETSTLQEVTDEGATTTNTITINKVENEQALVIYGDNATNGLIQVSASNDGTCIKADAGDGTSILVSNNSGVAVRATTAEGTAVSATSTTVDGAAIAVDATDGGKGIVITNGGVSIYGTVNPLTTYQLYLSANSAAKPSTNTWTITSDERIKTNINPYTKGLETILAINPVTYDYNGKAGFDPTNIGNIGIIAQDVLNIIPESINTYNALFNEDDEEKTELYNFDSHALTFILINAVKQLNAEIELLKTQLT